MVRPVALAAGVLFCVAPGVRADDARRVPGTMRLPVTAAEIAEAVRLHRVDPSTVAVDAVRLAFASGARPSGDESGARAGLVRALSRAGDGDQVPLPLSADTWRAHVVGPDVPDGRLAGAILSRRSSALLYHALMGMDPETLLWIERHPAAIAPLLEHAPRAALYARSIRIRNGIVETPGESARELWRSLIGADPADPLAFMAKLLGAESGRLAAFYDAIAHTDPGHRAFAIGRAGDRGRIERAAGLMRAVTGAAAAWRVDDQPFLKPDLDLAVVLRAIAVNDDGTVRAPASRALWSEVFGTRYGGGSDIDAAWLARALLDCPAIIGRRRLHTLAFAQRVFAGHGGDADLTFVLTRQSAFATLLSVLDDNGLRDPASYAAAIRAASSFEHDEDGMTVLQSSLAILDAARRAGTLSLDAARAAIESLLQAVASRRRGASLLAWISSELPARLQAGGTAVEAPDLERRVLAALAGTSVTTPAVRWEGQDYVVDLSRAELGRLLRTRQEQHEVSLDAALAASSVGRMRPLARSLAGIVYAMAFGQPDRTAVSGNQVWTRHRLGGDGAGPDIKSFAWQMATEVMGSGNWHLNGSLLYLNVALGEQALRRLDDSEVPIPSRLSTIDRRMFVMAISLLDPRRVTDEQRDLIAEAIARGRDRVARLSADAGGFEEIAAAAGIGEWRRNGLRWLLEDGPRRIADAFTILELYRIGGGAPLDSWGTPAIPLDGCTCLRMPPPAAWEDSAGRPSTGLLATQFADVMLRTAGVLAARGLPAMLVRDVAAFAISDALDRAGAASTDDALAVALAARDLEEYRFDDYIAALTAMGPLVPVMKDR
jgi:hypothetical protein